MVTKGKKNVLSGSVAAKSHTAPVANDYTGRVAAGFREKIYKLLGSLYISLF